MTERFEELYADRDRDGPAAAPRIPVDYRVADLLSLPGAWLGAFALVVESMNVHGRWTAPRWPCWRSD